MAIELNGLIEATDYNTIRSTVNTVLGTGDGDQIGYGQTLVSSEVNQGEIVTAQKLLELFTDINTAYTHQNGVSLPLSLLESPSVGDTARYNLGTEGILDFQTAANQILSNQGDFADTQMSVVNAGQSIRNTTWGGGSQPQSIVHQFTITFASASARRYYFNSGGEIRFNANLSGGTSVSGDTTTTPPGTKDEIWQTMLNNMGTVRFRKSNTESTGIGAAGGTGSDIGNYDLTTDDQTIFTKTGSGVYSDSSYYIEARSPDAETIQFTITFNDGDIGTNPTYPADESVTGTVQSTVSTFRATGALTIPNPSYTLNFAL